MSKHSPLRMSRPASALGSGCLALVLLAACDREPPDLPTGHVRWTGADGKAVLELRARDYGYALLDDARSLRARIHLPRNQAVAKAFVVAGPVRIDLSGSLSRARGGRLRPELHPMGLDLIEEAGTVGSRLRIDWPDAQSVTVLDRAGAVIGKARQEQPSGQKVAEPSTLLYCPDGSPRGKITGFSVRPAAVFLLPDLDVLEKSALSVYLHRFR